MSDNDKAHLAMLKSAMRMYEEAFEKLGNLTLVRVMLNDRDIFYSGHAFVAINRNRRMQISIDNEGLPGGFIKNMGLNDEIRLIHILLRSDDLKIEECGKVFRDWIIDELPEDAVIPDLLKIS